MVAAQTNPLILCVDDYKNILDGWRMLLQNEGYNVLTAQDRSSALELFIRYPVDEVILDSELPETPGDVIARRMKALKPGVPILMLSGNDPLPHEKLKQVEAFLFKRDSIATLLTLVKQLLKNRGSVSRFAIPNQNGGAGPSSMEHWCGTAQATAA